MTAADPSSHAATDDRASPPEDVPANTLTQVNNCVSHARIRSRFLRRLSSAAILWAVIMWVFPLLFMPVLIPGDGFASAMEGAVWLLLWGTPAICLTVYLLHKQRHTHVMRQRLFALVTALSVSELVQLALCHWRHRTSAQCLRELTRILVDNDRAGVTIRVSAPWQAWPVVPLGASFEPRQLKQTELQHDELFLSPMREQVDASRWPATWRSAVSKGNVVQQWSNWFSDYKQLWALGAFGLIVGLGVSLVLALILVGGVVAVGVLIGGLTSAGRCYLVPGGLVIRAKWWGEHRLFDRRRCVLGVVRTNRDLWDVVIADAERIKTLLLGDIEVMALLMAWLSPVEPPTPEQLAGSL